MTVIGLKINEDKTKHMVSSIKGNDNAQNFMVQDYNFERVDSFVYLVSTMKIKNNVKEEVKRKIMLGIKRYFSF